MDFTSFRPVLGIGGARPRLGNTYENSNKKVKEVHVPKDFPGPVPPSMTETEKTRFAKFFEDPERLMCDTGGVVMDLWGRIVLWHLPNIIHRRRLVGVILPVPKGR